MASMNTETKGKIKIQMTSEILPKNANTEKILKQRAEEEAQRKAKEDAVSTLPYELQSSQTVTLTLDASHQRERGD